MDGPSEKKMKKQRNCPVFIRVNDNWSVGQEPLGIFLKKLPSWTGDIFLRIFEKNGLVYDGCHLNVDRWYYLI